LIVFLFHLPKIKKGKNMYNGNDSNNDYDNLKLLGRRLTEPFIKKTAQGGSLMVRTLSSSLKEYADNNGNQTSKIILQIIDDSLNATNINQRLNIAPHGWFDALELLHILEKNKLDEGIFVLSRLIQHAEVHPQVRALASIIYYQWTNTRHSHHQFVINVLLNWNGQLATFETEKLHNRLLENNLLTEEMILSHLPICQSGMSLSFLEKIPPSNVAYRIQRIIEWLENNLLNYWICEPETLVEVISHIYQLSYTSEDAQRIFTLIELTLDSLDSKKIFYRFHYTDLKALQRKFGRVSDKDLDKLWPWEKMLVKWQLLNLDWQKASEMLYQANAIPQHSDDKINSITNIVMADDAIEKLFGWRMHSTTIRNPFYEYPHDKLFEELAEFISPPLKVENIQIEPASEDVGTEYEKISFTCNNRAFSFYVYVDDGFDVDSVVKAVNWLLGQIGRDERLFRIFELRSGGGEAAYFISGHGEQLSDACQTLKIPLYNQ